jgi:hypothetical protein
MLPFPNRHPQARGNVNNQRAQDNTGWWIVILRPTPMFAQRHQIVWISPNFCSFSDVLSYFNIVNNLVDALWHMQETGPHLTSIIHSRHSMSHPLVHVPSLNSLDDIQ